MTIQEAIKSGKEFKMFGADDFFWIKVEDDFFKFTGEIMKDTQVVLLPYMVLSDWEIKE